MIYILNNEGKPRYEYLEDTRNRTTVRVILSTTIICLSLIFIGFSVWDFNNTLQIATNDHVAYLNWRSPILHATSERFLSFGLDSSLLRDMENLPILNEKFINLARHLAPAFVRVGGTSADCLYFNKTVDESSGSVYSRVDGQDISNFSITDRNFKDLYTFATKARLSMIFDLNVLHRNPDNTWDDTNALEIIRFARKNNMKLDWQLGNEPNSFYHVFNVRISAEQLAKDYYHLRQLLKNETYGQSLLVGPEVNHVMDDSHKGELYAKTFLENEQDSVDYISWHQYYFSGSDARLEEFVNAGIFNLLPAQIMSMDKILRSSGKGATTWLSETSTAYGGGAPELSDRFVAGFLWLDKLGYSASAGVNVVTRQSFFGGNYAMVGPDLLPNPDWWVSVAYKQFVSERVLKLTTPDNFGRVRLYAHCTSGKALINNAPGITIYGVNINDAPIRLSIEGIGPILNNDAIMYFYALTSDNLQSRNIRMNGELLRLRSDGGLPNFRAVIQDPSDVVVLPPYSMVFLVIHSVKLSTCLM